jgi:hypothetical protein
MAIIVCASHATEMVMIAGASHNIIPMISIAMRDVGCAIRTGTGVIISTTVARGTGTEMTEATTTGERVSSASS